MIYQPTSTIYTYLLVLEHEKSQGKINAPRLESKDIQMQTVSNPALPCIRKQLISIVNTDFLQDLLPNCLFIRFTAQIFIRIAGIVTVLPTKIELYMVFRTFLADNTLFTNGSKFTGIAVKCPHGHGSGMFYILIKHYYS